MSSPLGSAGSGSGRATDTTSPATSLRFASPAGLPPTSTAPCLINACTRLREMLGPSFAASH